MSRPRSRVKKAHVNAYVSQALADEFRRVAAAYSGRLGLCLSAAMLMFLDAAPEAQAGHMQRVFEAELRDDVQALLASGAGPRRGSAGARRAGPRRGRPGV